MTLCLVTVSAQYCTFSSFWTVNLEWPICSLLCWNVFLLFWLALGDFWTLVEEILLLLRFYCITEILIQKILLAFWLIHYRSCFFFFPFPVSVSAFLCYTWWFLSCLWYSFVTYMKCALLCIFMDNSCPILLCMFYLIII